MKYSGVPGCQLFCLSLMPHLLAVKRSIASPFGLDWRITRRLEGNSVWQSSSAHIVLDQTEGDCCFVKDLFYDMESASHQASCGRTPPYLREQPFCNFVGLTIVRTSQTKDLGECGAFFRLFVSQIV
mmetsp:Transcript_24827/g.57002  ORF Transcript_24827/g.57002 Transcript_24827/m.57002 type:complete len:127 (+) Transcript_24827:538-918(+)